MTMNALRYDFVDYNLQKSYEETGAEYTNQELRQKILEQTRNVLEHNKAFENVEFNKALVSTKLRTDELVGITFALNALANDLNKRREMTRFQHLKAAITGGVQ